MSLFYVEGDGKLDSVTLRLSSERFVLKVYAFDPEGLFSALASIRIM
jgi:hypothetical protein